MSSIISKITSFYGSNRIFFFLLKLMQTVKHKNPMLTINRIILMLDGLRLIQLWSLEAEALGNWLG